MATEHRAVERPCACCAKVVDDAVGLHARREIAVCFQCLDWLNLQRDRRLEGRGGGWMSTGVEPVFRVRDLARSADHYERLGFSVGHRDATHAVAARDRAVTIRLNLSTWPDQAGHGALYLHVPDVDEVAGAWRMAGVEVVGPDEIDGVREGAHTDPDGNMIRFGTSMVTPPT